MDKKIKVVSTVDYNVGLFVPEINLVRNFSKEGASYLIDSELLAEALNYPGVRAIFDDGLLIIPEENDRIELGLQAEGDGDIYKIKMMGKEDFLTLLEAGTLEELKDIVQYMSREQIERLAYIAIENKVMDYNKINFIKSISGIDILECIKNMKDKEA